MFLNKFLLFLTIVITTALIFAHGKHKKKSSEQDTITIVGTDTIAINGKPVNKGLLAARKEAEIREQEANKGHDEENKEVTFSKLFEHLHNKIIHFPIALSVGAFLLILLGYKDEKMIKAVKILIPFATLMAIIAVFTGINQSGVFEGEKVYSLVEIHRTLGIISAALLLIWSISLFWKKLKKYSLLIAIITLLLISITAFYGGIIAH